MAMDTQILAGRIERLLRMSGQAEASVMNLYPNPRSGMNNDTWIAGIPSGQVLYRHPGVGSERFCDRRLEECAYRALQPYGVTDELIAFDVDTGEKLTRFSANARTCDPHNGNDVRAAMALLRRLHALPLLLAGRDDPLARMHRYLALAEREGADAARLRVCRALAQRADALQGWIQPPGQPLCPVHCDALPDNFLIRSDGEMVLIDLEFASMGDPFCDLADFCHDADYSKSETLQALADYLGCVPDRDMRRRLFACCACIALMWSGWAACKSRMELDRTRFYAEYFERSIRFCEQALAWFEEA